MSEKAMRKELFKNSTFPTSKTSAEPMKRQSKKLEPPAETYITYKAISIYQPAS